MNTEQQKAYKWAKNQNYQSVAARHAKILTEVIDALALQLSATTHFAPGQALTLEQLWQMDGEPVWVEYIGHIGDEKAPYEPPMKHWCWVEVREGKLDVYPCDSEEAFTYSYVVSGYGKSWTAYMPTLILSSGDTATIQDMSLSQRLEKQAIENSQLRSVIQQFDTDFFTRKCHVCGCDWNHPCEGGCSWVGEDLCSKCFQKKLIEGRM